MTDYLYPEAKSSPKPKPEAKAPPAPTERATKARGNPTAHRRLGHSAIPT